VLKAINKHPKPTEIVFSNHMARVESDECTGCETCLDRCQMNALRINDEDVAEVNKDRCIGCGLCVTTCDTQAIRLIPKRETEYQVPPANSAEQMMLMAQKRGLT
jgi:Na+-translocating ferredoxin:NAD+ oxidoreductase RNF subunit RnfB